MRRARWAGLLTVAAAMGWGTPAALAQSATGNEKFWTEVFKPSRSRAGAPARRPATAAPAAVASPLVTGSVASAVTAGELAWPIKRAVPRLAVAGNELAFEIGPSGRLPQPAAAAERVSSPMFAAHAELPPGAQILVTDVATGRAILVTVAVRQPAGAETVVDLSPAAVQALGGRPPAQVRLLVVWRPTGEPMFFPALPAFAGSPALPAFAGGPPLR